MCNMRARISSKGKIRLEKVCAEKVKEKRLAEENLEGN